MLLSFALMKIEFIWNSLFEITGRQTLCFIFLGFLLLVFFTAFLPKTLWKNCHFLKHIVKIQFRIYYFDKFYDLKPATSKI